MQSNTIHYFHYNRLPPLWVIFLYPLFSLLLNHSLKIITTKQSIAFLVGFLVAPLSYVAGLSLGGLTFSHSFIPTWMVIGICWGLFLCFLTKINAIIEKATEDTLKDLDSKLVISLLYDGECPICKREVCILQKKQDASKVKFIDISSNEFLSSSPSVDYNTAMGQIHAIDSEGNLLVGVPAFAAVYARCGLLITSTLFRISFIKMILHPLYKLFAKNRLWITGRSTVFKK